MNSQFEGAHADAWKQHHLTAAFTSILADVRSPWDVTIDCELQTGLCNVDSDDWTLAITRWPNGEAWIALDDEAGNEGECKALLMTTVGDDLIQAFRDKGGAFALELAEALRRSDDPLSIALAGMLVDN